MSEQPRSGAPVHRPMLQVLRHAPRPVWVLIAGTFVNRAGSYFSTFVVLFLTERGFGAGALPLVLAAVGVSAIAGSMLGGWLADRIGRKRTIVCSMSASALALGALALVSGHVAVVAVVCIVALCTQAYLPAASALLVDHTAPHDRVALFALFRVALNLGAALGPLIVVFGSASYDALFVIDGATCLLFAMLLTAGLPTEAGAAGGDQARLRDPSPRTAVRLPGGGSLPVLLLCLGITGVTLVYAQHTSTLPLQLTANGMSAQFYGLLLAVNGLLVVVCELPLASVTRRYEPTRPILAGALLITTGMALSGLLSTPAAILAAVAMWSFGEMVLNPVVSSAVAALSAPDRVARDQAWIASSHTIGFCVGPVLGVLVYAGDPQLTWVACLAIGAASALAIRLARVTSRARESARRSPRIALPAATGAAPSTNVHV